MKLIYQGKEFNVDGEGFLNDQDQFCEAWVEYVRTQENTKELTNAHYMVLSFVRNYYEQRKKLPSIRVLTKGTNLFMKDIFLLFPKGMTGIYKMAGHKKSCGCC